MRIPATIWKAITVSVSGVGMTTAPSDLGTFLHSVADWVEDGGSINIFFGLIIIIFGLWMAFDVYKWASSRRNESSVGRTETDQNCADYAEVTHVIGQYLEHALAGKRAGVSLSIKKDIADRFGDVPGAKLSEYEYNRPLLHQWLQANAARFIVQNRGDMR